MPAAGEPEQLRGMSSSDALVPMFGVKPEAGRLFIREEDVRTANPVALLTHSFWQSHFHGSPSAVGQKLILNDKVFTIVGVLPEDFAFAANVQVLTPIRLDTTVAPAGLNFLAMVVKLRPGVSPDQARTAMKAMVPRLQKIDSDLVPGTVTQYQESLVRDSRPLLFVLLGAVVSVLLIACANTANLLLARATSRSKEIAVRISLGAGRLRLVRQLLTESLLLSVLGGVVGTLLAWSGLGVLTTLLAQRLPRSVAIHIDLTVLLFTPE